MVLLLKRCGVTNPIYPSWFWFECDVGFSIELVPCLFGSVIWFGFYGFCWVFWPSILVANFNLWFSFFFFLLVVVGEIESGFWVVFGSGSGEMLIYALNGVLNTLLLVLIFWFIYFFWGVHDPWWDLLLFLARVALELDALIQNLQLGRLYSAMDLELSTIFFPLILFLEAYCFKLGRGPCNCLLKMQVKWLNISSGKKRNNKVKNKKMKWKTETSWLFLPGDPLLWITCGMWC